MWWSRYVSELQGVTCFERAITVPYQTTGSVANVDPPTGCTAEFDRFVHRVLSTYNIERPTELTGDVIIDRTSYIAHPRAHGKSTVKPHIVHGVTWYMHDWLQPLGYRLLTPELQ
jgi:hypothetical protein